MKDVHKVWRRAAMRVEYRGCPQDAAPDTLDRPQAAPNLHSLSERGLFPGRAWLRAGAMPAAARRAHLTGALGVPLRREPSAQRARAAAGRFLGAACMCLLLVGCVAPIGASAYESEAAFILKIVRFVRWPEGTFANSQTTLRLCIVGTDAGDASIADLAGQRLKDKVIAVARLANPDQAATECEIVFIDRSERDRVATLLNPLARTPVLTISDIDGFTSDGGMVGFNTAGNRINFEINVAASKRAGLAIGAQLLQIATLSPDERMGVGP